MSGYTYCACRDCFEIAIGAPGAAICHECERAGCQVAAEAGDPSHALECQAPGAYGCDLDAPEPA